MTYIPNSDMTANLPDDKGQEGDNFIRKQKRRRFWYHFSMFWVSCFALWLVIPTFEKEFFRSGKDFDTIVTAFSNVRSAIGFIIMSIVTFAALIYDFRFWRKIREYEESTKRKLLPWYRLWWWW